MNLSDAIKAEIGRRGLTAYAVAKLAGITPNVVSRFLSGERDITLATADKVATALGLSWCELPSCRPHDRPSIAETTGR